jgi:hypothetical protein
MNTTLAILLLLTALVVFAYAVVTLVRKTEKADAELHRASIIYNRTWVLASMLAAAGMTLLLDLRWIWIGFLWGGWLLVGWYCKWFGIPILGEKFLRRPVGLWDWQDTTNLRNVLPGEIVTLKSLIVSIAGVLFFAFMLLFVFLDVGHEVDLQQEGKTVKAIVTNERIMTTRNSPSYEVQYRFSPDDGTSWYTASDAMGRSNLWMSLTKQDYDVAVASGKVDVIFLPQNPWVNRPLRRDASTPTPVTLVIGGFLVFAFTLYYFNDSRKYVAQRLGKEQWNSWS